ncbi:MAG TPA: TonB-dependent receptor [Candidatus Angelobacter sp.]
MRRLCIYCSILLMCLSLASLAFGQSAASATIVGAVTDTQGAVIPNATVTATNTATGVGHSAKTTSSGNYTIPNLPPGSYDIKVEAASFATSESKGVKLNVGDQRDVNVTLGAAGKSEVVEVTAAAPLIETTKTAVSTAVTDLDMERLPTFAAASGGINDYAQLALTAPGVKLDTSTLTTGGDQLIGPGTINTRANLYNVDGANITDQVTSGRDTLGASVDEVQEFQVLTNNYNAEYGQAGGLILNVVTKSGTNGIHGDAHTYLRGRNLAASKPLFNTSQFVDPVTGLVNNPACPHLGTTDIDGCPRAPFSRQEGGFTLGGPFVKDKLFWFVSYEIAHQTLPTVLTSTTVSSPTNQLLYSGKVDYKISSNHVLSARFNVDRFFTDNLIVQTSTNIAPETLTTQSIHNMGGNLGLTSSFTPNLVNEARFAILREVNTLPDKTTLPGQIHADGFVSGANFCCPQGGENKRYQYIDNLTWTHGNHTFKTGFNISYYPWFSLFQQFHFGQYTLDSSGAPTSFAFGVGPGEVTSKDNIYGVYLQDTWKITKKLTMNAGLRYDVEAGAFKGGKIKGPNGTCFQGNGVIPACSSDYNNVQPRLGFTYAPWAGTLIKASFAEVTQLAFNNVVLDSLNFDGTTLNTIQTSNPAVLAAFPNAPNPALLTGAVLCPGPRCGRVRPIADNLRNPEYRMFNFGIQHELSKTLSAEIQYIGQFGFGLFGERDRNAPPVIADLAHPGFFFFGSRPDSRFLAIRTNENSRTSHYNGLLVSATKRYSNHVQFNASYTWSHAITSGEDFFGLSEPADYVNIRPELGPAFNDIRHAGNFGVVLDSGKVTNMKVVRWFTNDLGTSFIGQIQSGRPYPFSTGTSGVGASGRFFGTGSETQQRPNVLPNGTISTAGIAAFDGANALFGPGAVAACAAAGFPAAQCATIQNTFLAPVADSGAIDSLTGDPVDFQMVSGTMGRDAGRQSPFYKLDVSLKKEFKMAHERVGLELRADAFNVLNHANWQVFNGNNVTALLPFGSMNPLAPAGPKGNLFNCTLCQRPNGTLVGTTGQILNIANIQNGKFDNNLVNPIFGGIGDPSDSDIPRTFQLSFHVRF